MFRPLLATVLAVGICASGGRIGWADRAPVPDDDTPDAGSDAGSGSGSGSAEPPDRDHDRDHDRDLDHDDARPREAPQAPHAGDATDGPLYSPRMGASNKDIVIETPGERSSQNIAVLTSLASAALATGLFGLYFHLKGKDAADDVSQSSFTGRTWSPMYQDDVDRAAKDRKLTIGFYSAGGALLVAAIVGLIVTEPKSSTTIIHPHTAVIAPVPGGAVVARGWTF